MVIFFFYYQSFIFHYFYGTLYLRISTAKVIGSVHEAERSYERELVVSSFSFLFFFLFKKEASNTRMIVVRTGFYEKTNWLTGFPYDLTTVFQ